LLYSHPKKKLIEHLKNVCQIGLKIYSEKKISFDFEESLLNKTLENTLLLHDFGKATHYFQEYLSAKIKGEECNETSELKNHSLLSALYASYKTYLETSNNILTLICFSSILKHHGDLENWTDIFFVDDNKVNILRQQYDSINFDELKELDLTKYEWKEIKSYLDELWIIEQDTKKGFEYFFLQKYIYSILVYSDKNEAIFGESFEFQFLPTNSSDLVYNFKKEKFKNTNPQEALNNIRNRFFEKAVEKVKSSSVPNIIFINIPTGLGKTLTGLQVALELLNKDKTLNKIIYAVPFMSIIDQNEEIIKEIFKINNLNHTEYFIKHHHLVEPKISIREDYFEGEKGQFLIENWDKPLILTTFWQIFYTIFSGDNKLNRKFHNLIGSVIILDEIQTIPMKYWKIIRDTLLFLTQKMNCKIIYMTATMPLIFTQQDITNYIEISFNDIDSYGKESINRYQIKIIEKLKEIEQDCIFDNIANEMREKKNKNFLFVLNTIKESIIFYQKIKEIKNEEDEIFYLSTNIIPKDRKRIINEIKEKLKQKRNGKIILVSTQLIEAGVDLDFDIVYRDLAPLDSIIQTAGRCNRNNREMGTIYLFNLKDEKGRSFYSYIYDQLSISPTKEFLEKQECLQELALFSNLNAYYESIQNRMSNDTYTTLKNYIENLAFQDIQEKFKLIDEIPSVLIFVEKNDEASNLLIQYSEIIKNFSGYERKNEFLKIKNNFYEYILSVYSNSNNLNALANFESINNFFILSKDKIDSFYNKEFGFITDFNSFY